MAGLRPSDTEQLLLLTAWRLEGDAYGLAIRDELEEKTGRRIAVGAIYSTMVRLEKKGWVRSHLSGPTPVRGGKAKRFYRITEDGKRTLEEARAAMDTLWEGLAAPNPTRKEA